MRPDPKPYSVSCDENREPILSVIEPLFSASRRLLEIGGGTGQHAVFFAAAMPHLLWQTSDVEENLPGIRAWLDEADLPNLPPPLVLDVHGAWPAAPFDAIFSANTAHIMPIEAVAAMFAGVGAVLEPGGCFALYGPFNMGGTFTSDSNRRFDAWLKARDPRMGVRHLEDLMTLAEGQGLELEANAAMPANNRTLVWRKTRPA
jgi:cyclopropane fatty-acyl-phospholipid synthase-like methyltransferase